MDHTNSVPFSSSSNAFNLSTSSAATLFDDAILDINSSSYDPVLELDMNIPLMTGPDDIGDMLSSADALISKTSMSSSTPTSLPTNSYATTSMPSTSLADIIDFSMSSSAPLTSTSNFMNVMAPTSSSSASYGLNSQLPHSQMVSSSQSSNFPSGILSSSSSAPVMQNPLYSSTTTSMSSPQQHVAMNSGKRPASSQQDISLDSFFNDDMPPSKKGHVPLSSSTAVLHHHPAPPPPQKNSGNDVPFAADSPEILKMKVRHYLDNLNRHGSSTCDQNVIIVHSRVVQKSYGNEKRFFCPPPSVQLIGDRWKNHDFGKLRVFVSMGSIHADCEHHEIQLNDNLYGTCRTLFIPDSDKRKSLCLYFKCFFDSGRDIGTFKSKPIKVISKPSKKKVNSKNNTDTCIEDGSEIVLFNRVRAQSGSTRFLTGTEGGGLKISTSTWESFTVSIVDAQSDESIARKKPRARSKYIMYGDLIHMKCNRTGLTHGPFVVSKLSKSRKVEIDCDNAVTQLHKIGLRLTSSVNGYVTLGDSGKVDIVPCRITNNMHSLADGACWTVATCDRVHQRFYDPSPSTSKVPVNPIPTVEVIKSLADVVELYGTGFTTMLSVWFGDVKAESWYRCEELIMCKRPPYKDICPSTTDGICRSPVTIDILLVRDDGFIYHSGKKYTYKIDHISLLRELAQRHRQ
eukprot:m.77448 g.77448  ORF g.77448 m.77448 type:complete len:684 (+) comp8543_c0_seq9:99-2150(+)